MWTLDDALRASLVESRAVLPESGAHRNAHKRDCHVLTRATTISRKIVQDRRRSLPSSFFTRAAGSGTLGQETNAVMTGLVLVIHVVKPPDIPTLAGSGAAWIAGTSPRAASRRAMDKPGRD